MIQKRKQTLLGHIIRQSKRKPNDPIVQVTFRNKHIEPRSPICRRVGRPRAKWTEEVMSMAWEKIKPDQIYGPNDIFKNRKEQRKKIKKKALKRQFPFEKKTKKKNKPLKNANKIKNEDKIEPSVVPSV